MDNYYFSLDKNTKRFIQFLTIDWVEAKNLNSTIQIVKKVIKNYPITIPLLCSTKVTIENNSCRFIEYIVKNISENSFPIVKEIV